MSTIAKACEILKRSSLERKSYSQAIRYDTYQLLSIINGHRKTHLENSLEMIPTVHSPNMIKRQQVNVKQGYMNQSEVTHDTF